MFVDIIRVFIL